MAGPRILPWVLKPFVRYINWSLKRQFHALRVDACGLPPELDPGTPAVVYLNHASWWDPLLMMWLGANVYPGRDQYGPIEASQLQRYGFFKHLGIFGVEKGTASGARVFLRTAQEADAAGPVCGCARKTGAFCARFGAPCGEASGGGLCAACRRIWVWGGAAA